MDTNRKTALFPKFVPSAELAPEPGPASERTFAEANRFKASFADAYDATSPAAYLRELAPLDYRIPDEATEATAGLVEEVRAARSRETVTVLDIGCSYGINAAVMKHGTSFRTLAQRYGRIDAAAPTGAAARRDRAFFASLRRNPGLRVVGLDVAGNAVSYGLESGLLDDGVVANLERHPLSSADRRRLQGVDLIVTTGCVGYVGEATFTKVVDAIAAQGETPLVASFVLRMFPYGAIARALRARGMETRKEAQTYRQRRFKSAGERTKVLSALRDRGLDPSGLEARDDYLRAELFVSRPNPV